MNIKDIQGFCVRIPLDSPYIFARGSMLVFENVVVRITTDEGLIGYGESAPLPLGKGDNAESISSIINGTLSKTFKGYSIYDIEYIISRAMEMTDGNADAVAGLDLALWDLLGKYLKQPVYRLIGGLCQDTIAVDYTLSASNPSDMAEKAKKIHVEGFEGMIVKITGKSIQEDIERVRFVRESIPEPCRVSVDCNACYNRDEALEFLNGIKDFKVEYIEQPVAAEDFEGMRICRAVGIPIVADESLVTSKDALTLIREQACDIMNIKVPKAGGLFMSKRIASIASAAGIPIICGGRTTFDISRYASRHFAASTYGCRNLSHVGAGPASQALSDDVVEDRTTREKVKRGDGTLRVEQNPGLGFKINWDKVERYSVH